MFRNAWWRIAGKSPDAATTVSGLLLFILPGRLANLSASGGRHIE
jgi:hypothetical protein